MTEISWQGATAEKRMHDNLGLEIIQWCETPSPGSSSEGSPNLKLSPLVLINNPAGHERGAARPRLKTLKSSNAGIMQLRKRNPFEHLSDELVINIFRYLEQSDLGQCSLVCRSWRRLALDESLWRIMKVSGKLLDPEILFRAIDRNPRNLIIQNCDLEDFDPLVEHVKSTQKRQRRSMLRVQKLNLACTRVSDGTISKLLRLMPKLMVLEFGGNTDLTDDTAMTIAENCPNLRSLSLRMVAGITNVGIEAIVRSCPKLRVLSLGWICDGHQNGHVFVDSMIASLATHAQNLIHLDLSGCREFMKDAHTEVLLQSCTKLKTIDLSDSYELTDSTVESIIRYLPFVENVSLSRCHRVTVPAMQNLAQKPGIKQINLFGCYQNVDLQLKELRPDLQVNAGVLSSIDFEAYHDY